MWPLCDLGFFGKDWSDGFEEGPRRNLGCRVVWELSRFLQRLEVELLDDEVAFRLGMGVLIRYDRGGLLWRSWGVEI